MRKQRQLSICRLATFLFLFISSSLIATAQQKTISGKITDAKTNDPVTNASIIIKGKKTGTSTDENGAFTITASPGDRLQITSTEYTTVEVAVGDANTLSITMNRLVSNLNEVVVIGYGTVRKKDLTGAVSSLKGSDLKSEGIINVSRAMQGKMPGVTIESAGGDPGSGTRILVRGVGTMRTQNPLYIVDGVQVGGINNISPADIESIDVLKDASAASIYGSRAANGVVLITTKTGKPGKPIITFNTNLGVQKLAKKYDVLNAEEWANVSNAAHDAAKLARLPMAANPSQLGAGTDWQDAIFRSATMQQYNLSAGGGTQNSRYSISGEYNDQQGIVDITGYKRYGMRAKSETTLGRLKVGETIILSREKFTRMPGGWGGQGGNPVGSAVKMIPVFDIYDTSAIGGYGGAYGSVVNVANPVAQLNLESITYELTSLLANAYAEVTILPSLKYKFNLGYTGSFSETNDYYKRHKTGGLFSHTTNDLSQAKTRDLLAQLENTLHYNHDFGKHSVQALAGYAYQRYKYYYWNAAKTNLPDGLQVLDVGSGTATVNGNRTENVLLSLLGRVIYSYDNRYLLTASFRRDGSSRFGRANRFGNFPSVALGWNISNESFFKNAPKVLSTLKLRGSFGVLGNQEIPDYMYSAAIASNINYVTGEDQQKWFGAIQTAFASPDIKWENTETYNVGIDAGLFNNSLNITADYFIKKTTDVLLEVPVPGSAGSATSPTVNAGTLQNKGLELGLNYSNSLGKINYSVYGTFTAVKNKVLKLGTGTQQIFGGQPTHHGAQTTLTQAGGEVSGFYLIKALGIFQSQQEVDAYVDKNGKKIQPAAMPGDIKFLDANGDGMISNTDRVDGGSPFPNFDYGFGIKANAYHFDINMYLQGTSGNKIYNGLRQDMEGMNLEINYSRATLNAWTPQNHSNIPRAVIDDPNFNAQTSSRFLENGSYLRMRTLQIGYTIPETLVQKLKITSLRAYFSADNLFTITNYSGFNPDIGRSGSILDRGVDYGHVAYPIARTLSVGIQLSL
ncbi:SusC/RagA family TonB-linked outer membrane protein [Niastella sp. OAS944]|uniref:SusC/RagA family TonB-linked outer membrane protein n=1 Tax=Niastella sp. OAS944 TaxID=2664089 RepID=UPI003490CAFB|nr:TonB-linked SusC/RagA family outer membrane protein [Chitinophagaceae bacterium OAS944]